MHKKRKVIIGILIALVALVGGIFYFKTVSECFASGGGASVKTPEFITRNTPATLGLTLNQWGKTRCIRKDLWRDKKPTDIYKNIECHYKTPDEKAYHSVPMNLKDEKLEETSYTATYECGIPAINSNAPSLVYYFDYEYAGIKQNIEQKTLTIK